MGFATRRLFLSAPLFVPWVAAGLAVCVFAWWFREPASHFAPRAPRASISPAAVLAAGDIDGFARALDTRTLEFPADHGPHREYRTEWWYYTGNLEAASGARFGYQLTFFRTGLTPKPRRSSSAWAAGEVWMAHLTLTDVGAARFEAAERFGRDGLGLAGARAQPFELWLGDFRVLDGRLSAAERDFGIELTLAATEPVLHGEAGLSRKGRAPGNASYYYSCTRMPTRGRVRIGGEAFEVRGLTWMDHEWSTSALEHGQVGWDWFGLQLDDGRDLMVFDLRRDDGTRDAMSQGSLILGTEVRSLSQDEFSIRVLEHWRSPRSGVRYPSRWRIEVPAEGIALEVAPLLADQELRMGVRYWEGAVRVEGSFSGRGYAELVGYGD
jgi:predicted secreted hydrolase